MTCDNAYHKGELEVQARAGVTQAARMSAGALNDRIPAAAMHFIGEQSMAVLGSLDADGNVWASILFGNPGFLRATDELTLHLHRSACHSAPGDPLWKNLEKDPRLGILLVELVSRRRLRINGNARPSAGGDCLVAVERAYANCPKYIQRRRLEFPGTAWAESPLPCREGRQLNAAQQAWIGHADTFFVASAHPDQGVDASHRGGHPGFVKVLNPHRLRIPDFAGNNMFNTLGNFAGHPHAGLVFIDFKRDRILQMSGRPELLWDEPDESGETGGTMRYWEFEVEIWRESQLPLRLQWQFIDYSPFIPTPRDDDAGTQSINLKAVRVWFETSRVKGFELVALDGGKLPPFEAGAHLPIKVRDRRGYWVERNYSLLSDPADRSRYRIGVLAEPNGRGGSLYLHQAIQAGDILQAMPPKNGFALATEADHSILLAGGIGITPLLSMLHVLKATGKSFELHYSARRKADLGFRQDIEHLIGKRARFYASEEPGQHRLDLQRVLAGRASGTHVYVCGPRPMILAVRDLARSNGWLPEQIHYENFGKSVSSEDQALSVTLARSGKTIGVPATRSILDVLLGQGLAVPHDCRRGECTLCVTRVIEGEPDHRDLCLSAEEQALSMCLCVSRAKTDSLTLDL